MWMKRPAVAMAVLTAGLVIGGVVYAAIPSADGTIHACVNERGLLRVVDAEAGGSCSGNERPLSWNQLGPPGPQGEQGPAGEPGPQGEPGQSESGEAVVGRSPILWVPLGIREVNAVVVPEEGAYVVWAAANIHNQGSVDANTGCELWIEGRQLSSQIVGVGPGQSEDSHAAISMVGWTPVVPAGTRIWMNCFTNYNEQLMTSNQMAAVRAESVTQQFLVQP